SAEGVSPKFCPAFRNIGGTLRTPLTVETTIGKKDARKIRKIADWFPMPNQTIASGIQARGLIGRIIWMSGFTAAAALGYQPSARPAGIPNNSASKYPTPTRNSESPI